MLSTGKTKLWFYDKNPLSENNTNKKSKTNNNHSFALNYFKLYTIFVIIKYTILVFTIKYFRFY